MKSLRYSVVRALPGPLALAAAIVSTPASAGFPTGDFLKQAEEARFRHVCQSSPATPCTLVDLDGLFTGAECTPPAAASCVIDFVPEKQLRGVLTVIADDVVPAVPDGNIRTAVLLELQVGEETFFLADTFPEAEQIGAWNPVPGENSIFQIGFGGGALFQNNLAPLGARIEAIAAAKLGVDTATSDPVIVEGLTLSPTPTGTPKTPPDFPTAGNPAPVDALGQVARYRVTIRFAKNP